MVYNCLYRVHCPVYICSPNLYIFKSTPSPIIVHKNILCTLLEKLTNYYSVHWSMQSTLYSPYLLCKSITESTPSHITVHTENILSTLFKRLIKYCSVHRSTPSTLSSLYLLFKSMCIPEYTILYHFTLTISCLQLS